MYRYRYVYANSASPYSAPVYSTANAALRAGADALNAKPTNTVCSIVCQLVELEDAKSI